MTWYVVHSKPACEWQAKVNIERQGFRAFLPYVIHTRPAGRRLEGIVAAYFSRYLFVDLLEGQPLRPVGNSYGVSAIVGDSVTGPLIVPATIMEELHARCSPDGLVTDDRRKPPPAWAVGQHVTVTKGALAGFVGEILRLDGIPEVEVWLLNRKVRAKIDPANLAA
jgi:transcriptional antiterminator RfaH